MEALQHSFLFRDYFRKKAKYEEKQKKEMEQIRQFKQTVKSSNNMRGIVKYTLLKRMGF